MLHKSLQHMATPIPRAISAPKIVRHNSFIPHMATIPMRRGISAPSSPNFPVTLPPLLLRRLQPVRSCRSSSTLSDVGGSKGMTWFHEMELQVREYELDQYGVVNNAVYPKYCEYVGHQLFDRIFDDDTTLAVTEMSFKFISPLQKKDKFLLKVRIYDYSATRLFSEHLIFKLPNYEPILKARITVVFLDKNYRPSRMTPGMVSMFNKFRVSETGEKREGAEPINTFFALQP